MNPVEQIAQLSTGHWISQMVFAFVENKMADAFEGEPQSAEAIATKCKLRPDATYRLLRALSTIGVLKQQEDTPEIFELTELGCFLTQSHPMSMANKVLLEASSEHVQMWTHLSEYLRTGEHAPSKIFGLDNYFDLFESRPEHVEVFSKAMSCYTNDEIQMIQAMETLDFSGIEMMVDVGGAFGVMLSAILDKNPKMKGILFDLASVLSNVESTKQMEVVAGDFFTSVPANHDAYFLKHILHDWDDETCLKILGNIVDVMKSAAKIFIGEFGPVPGPNEPHLSKFFDLHMMINLHGKERTMAEWEYLLKRAGLKVAALHQSFGPLSVIEVTRQ